MSRPGACSGFVTAAGGLGGAVCARWFKWCAS